MRFATGLIFTTLLLTPISAQAADYLTYSFAFSGNASRTSNSQPSLNYNGAVTGNIVYNLPIYFAGATKSSFTIPAQFGQIHTVSASALDDIFTLSEIETQVGRSDRRAISIKTCLTPGIPGPALVVDPACSAVSFTDAISLGVKGGDLRTLTGTVTGLTITEGFGNATLGLVSYPVALLSAVPEPATWAMMILGFGLVGAAARYRRRTTKLDYA